MRLSGFNQCGGAQGIRGINRYNQARLDQTFCCYGHGGVVVDLAGGSNGAPSFPSSSETRLSALLARLCAPIRLGR